MTFSHFLGRHFSDLVGAVTFLVFASAFSLAGLVGWYRYLKRARLIEDTPTSRTRSAAQGYVELVGRQYAAPGRVVHAPLTGKPCTWWRYRIEQFKVDYTGDGRRRWVTQEESISEAAILIRDGKGQMLVDPRGAEVTPATQDTWYGNRESPARPMQISKRSKGRFRYTEERMHEGEHVYVSGELHTPGRHRNPISVDDAYNAQLDRWKHNQTELLRRFDANGDGRIDSEEWEVARAAARDEVIARLHPRDEGEAIDVIRKPHGSDPFILASKTPKEIAGKYRYLARNNLLVFIVCGAIALCIFYETFLKH